MYQCCLGRLTLGLLALAAVATGAIAQSYPDRPIRFLQGFAPGGNADVITRILGDEMTKSLGQPIINEARPGAGGNLASEATAKAAPDGYTIVLITTGHVISPALYKSQNFDAANDFDFISTVSELPFFVVVNADSRFKTIADLIAEAKAKPKMLTVGTAGVGSGQHMTSELLGVSIGSKFVHVPFRGDAGAVTALLGSQVDFIIAPGTAIFGNVEGGKFRLLAVSGAKRWPTYSQVPTIAESGAPGFEVNAWTGIATAKGTPRPVVDRLNKAVREAIAAPAVNEKLKGLASVPASSTPEEVTAKVKQQVNFWKEVATKAGLEKQ